MSQNRADHIDYLRGFAMLVMIANHVSAYFLQVPFAKILWDLGEVSVPVFIYCSVASFQLSSNKHFTWKKYIPKRLKRLLIPYWIFLAIESIRIYLQEGKIVDPTWMMKNIFLIGGLDLNWLVLLFIYLLFVIPIFVRLYTSYNKAYWSLMFFCFLVSTTGLFVNLHDWSRLVMIFGWTIIVGVSILLESTQFSLKRKILAVLGISLTYLLTNVYLINTGQKLFQYDHKYPPDIYHITWGMMGLMILVFLFKKYQARLMGKSILRFFSIYSYPIYFIHNFLLKGFFSWWWSR